MKEKPRRCHVFDVEPLKLLLVQKALVQPYLIGENLDLEEKYVLSIQLQHATLRLVNLKCEVVRLHHFRLFIRNPVFALLLTRIFTPSPASYV